MAPLGPVTANRELRAASATGELVLLQRQHSLLQEELLRLRAAENRFKDSERARAKLERQVRHMRACCGDKPLQVNMPISMAREELMSRVLTLELHFKNEMSSFQDPAQQQNAPQENSDLEVDMTSEDEDGTASES